MATARKKGEETPPSGEVATTPQITPSAYVEPAEYNPALETWEQAVTGAHEVLGHDLAKGVLLEALDGVPFLMTRFTFRPGIVADRDADLMKVGDVYAYVSIEAIIAPEAELRRRRVDLDTLPFDPESQVVFNDGSTGIYRQAVTYLAAIGAITLPDGPTEGGKGNVRYDLPPWKWTEFHAGEYKADEDGTGTYSINVRLRAPRGLRRSEYAYNNQDAETRYWG